MPNVKNVLQMSAGMRHSVVVAGVGGTGEQHAPPHTFIPLGYHLLAAVVMVMADGIPDVWAWGDNIYGQLGLGDMDIRLCPTIVTACRRMRVTGVSAGTCTTH